MILGVESSCDESAIALYCPSKGIVDEWVHSQIIHHAEYGGVVPDLAVSEHLTNFIPLLSLARKKYNLSSLVKKIAVTKGPGLVGCLGVGISLAKSLGLLWDVPVYGVNHLRGHAFSPFIQIPQDQGDGWQMYLPHLGLLVSGGNTLLFSMNQNKEISIIAKTVDDAAGEALDKGAKLLGIPYPGGAELEKRAQGGNFSAYNFPKAFAKKSDMKFSFSGLKTSLLYTLEKMSEEEIIVNFSDLSSSYQWAAVQQLVRKTGHAFELGNYKSIGLSGGVANNQLLRGQMGNLSKEKGIPLLCPEPRHTGDNATMIAFAAHVEGEKLSAEKNNELTFAPSLKLDGTSN